MWIYDQFFTFLNPLDSNGNYSGTSNNTKLVHWPLMGGLVHLVAYSEEGTGRAAAPPSPLLVVPNVTAHPSTASVPITVYDGPLLCGFNEAIKGLTLGDGHFIRYIISSHSRLTAAVLEESVLSGCSC